jgi:hypothetical protein
MQTELVEETAARLAVAALRADAEGEIALDAGTGALAAPPAAFRELVEPGSRLDTRRALAAAGAVRGGAVHPALLAAVTAVQGRRVAVLERAGAPPVELWSAPPAGALTSVDGAGRVRLVPLPAAALAAAAALLAGLDDGPAAPGSEERTTPAELVTRLAAAPGIHARLVAGAVVVEVLGGDDGWRTVDVEPDGALVLRARAAEDLRRAIGDALQRA